MCELTLCKKTMCEKSRFRTSSFRAQKKLKIMDKITRIRAQFYTYPSPIIKIRKIEITRV